jgi:hypothetical protein
MKKNVCIINYIRAGRGKTRGIMLNLLMALHNIYTVYVLFHSEKTLCCTRAESVIIRDQREILYYVIILYHLCVKSVIRYCIPV